MELEENWRKMPASIKNRVQIPMCEYCREKGYEHPLMLDGIAIAADQRDSVLRFKCPHCDSESDLTNFPISPELIRWIKKHV